VHEDVTGQAAQEPGTTRGEEQRESGVRGSVVGHRTAGLSRVRASKQQVRGGDVVVSPALKYLSQSKEKNNLQSVLYVGALEAKALHCCQTRLVGHLGVSCKDNKK
jgi:hypothetical protein